MRTALYQLGEDFLSTIVFLIAYLATGNLYLAVILAIVVGVGQFVLLKRRGRTPDVMSWLSLGLARPRRGCPRCKLPGRAQLRACSRAWAAIVTGSPVRGGFWTARFHGRHA